MADSAGDPRDIALAALTNLVRLMGAELVAGRHRDDCDQLERAVRDKIGALTVLGCTAQVAEAGLALARSHAEQALAQIRTQAIAAREHDLAQATAQRPLTAPSTATVLH